MLTLPNSHTPFLLVADRAVAAGAGLDTNAEPKSTNPFDMLDKLDPDRSHQYCPCYSPKVRYEPSEEQPPPAIWTQYLLKPWKELLKKPSLPKPTKKKPVAIKTKIGKDNCFGCKEMMDALLFEHPTVTLDLDCLSSNVHTIVENDLITKAIIEHIHGAVQVAWETKR